MWVYETMQHVLRPGLNNDLNETYELLTFSLSSFTVGYIMLKWATPWQYLPKLEVKWLET